MRKGERICQGELHLQVADRGCAKVFLHPQEYQDVGCGV